MGAVRDLWLRWKMLPLPWRKRFLVGQDLYGNTFWEFRDALNHDRWRRMVKSKGRPSLASLSDVKISPQWHQWLRYTRDKAPTMQEQAADVQRQAQLKVNARLADERWAAKAKYIGKPKPAATLKLSGDPKLDTAHAENTPGQPPQPEKISNVVDGNENQLEKAKETATNPGSTWKPETWTPGASKR